VLVLLIACGGPSANTETVTPLSEPEIAPEGTPAEYGADAGGSGDGEGQDPPPGEAPPSTATDEPPELGVDGGTGEVGVLRAMAGAWSAPVDEEGEATEPPAPGHVRSIPVDAQGALSREVVRRVIRRNVPSIQRCYGRRLQANPTLRGTLGARFVIREDGGVREVTIEPGPDDAELDGCILQAIGRWNFPMPERGIVSVRWRFELSPSPPPSE
jgi:hypothetical protein